MTPTGVICFAVAVCTEIVKYTFLKTHGIVEMNDFIFT